MPPAKCRICGYDKFGPIQPPTRADRAADAGLGCLGCLTGGLLGILLAPLHLIRLDGILNRFFVQCRACGTRYRK